MKSWQEEAKSYEKLFKYCNIICPLHGDYFRGVTETQLAGEWWACVEHKAEEKA